MTSEDGPPAAGEEPPDPGGGSREARYRERESRRREQSGTVPARGRRKTRIERGAMRGIGTCGIVGIGVALGAVLVGQNVAGWVVGLVVSAVSIILVALLWTTSRQV